eukprot:SAG11_NODE_11073_length_785_cov_1.580175_1_plen_172_part_10
MVNASSTRVDGGCESAHRVCSAADHGAASDGACGDNSNTTLMAVVALVVGLLAIYAFMAARMVDGGFVVTPKGERWAQVTRQYPNAVVLLTWLDDESRTRLSADKKDYVGFQLANKEQIEHLSLFSGFNFLCEALAGSSILKLGLSNIGLGPIGMKTLAETIPTIPGLAEVV